MNRLRPRVYITDLVEVVAKRGCLHLEYKDHFMNKEFKQLNFLKVSLATNTQQIPEPEKYTKSRGIPTLKRDNILKNLSSVMPKDRLKFWENIPTSDTSNDLIETFE